jgi:uncharacterized protein (TIGR03435 family)
MKRAILSAGLLAIASSVAFGQSPAAPPEFGVASVKASTAGKAGGAAGHWQTGPGSISMVNVTLRTAVQWAYDVKSYQVSAPGWMEDERYDIAAKSEGRVPTAQLRLMMQSLLAQRFKLAVHRETRELAVFALSIGKGGHKLHVSEGEGEAKLAPGKGGEMSLSAQHVPLSRLADLLSGALRAPVVDMTGLTGRYDFAIDLMAYIPMDADGKPAAGVENDVAGIVSNALQEQLGLKLEAKKTAVETIVVDKAEKTPTAN